MIAVLEGFALGGGLIVAIGAQNAFILRQGLLRSHVLPLCLVCALSDAMLIAVGVAGFGEIVRSSDNLLFVVRWAGAAFLLAYAALALKRAFSPKAMGAEGARLSLGTALATVLAFTFLNPHVYLDTVVLVGGLSATYEDDARWHFGAGAMLASFVWFFSLGYGARWLAPLFAKPVAWRVLDFAISAVMALLALRLIFGS